MAAETLPRLAWLYLEVGMVAEAATVVAQALARTRALARWRSVWWRWTTLVDALWVQASVAARQGHEAEAQDAIDEGLTLARRLRYPYGEARLLHLVGHMHAEKGARTPAREQLGAALAIFQRLGARDDSHRVEQALGELSLAP
jgi:hypothetical protein